MSSTSTPTTIAVSPRPCSPFPRSPGPPWPRSPSLPCLCSRGAAEESSYAVPRLDSTPASPWRARRRRPKLAQLAAPRHAALGRDLLEHVRTPVNASSPRPSHRRVGLGRNISAVSPWTSPCTPSTVRRIPRYKATPAPSANTTPPHSLTDPSQFAVHRQEGVLCRSHCRRRGPSWPRRHTAPFFPLWPALASLCFTALTAPFFPLDCVQIRRGIIAGARARGRGSCRPRRHRYTPSQQAQLALQPYPSLRRRFTSSPPSAVPSR